MPSAATDKVMEAGAEAVASEFDRVMDGLELAPDGYIVVARLQQALAEAAGLRDYKYGDFRAWLIARGCEWGVQKKVDGRNRKVVTEVAARSFLVVRGFGPRWTPQSGHGWTGRNRPPGRPRLVISIPRLPRDANPAGPWCASCADPRRRT